MYDIFVEEKETFKGYKQKRNLKLVNKSTNKISNIIMQFRIPEDLKIYSFSYNHGEPRFKFYIESNTAYHKLEKLIYNIRKNLQNDQAKYMDIVFMNEIGQLYIKVRDPKRILGESSPENYFFSCIEKLYLLFECIEYDDNAVNVRITIHKLKEKEGYETLKNEF